MKKKYETPNLEQQEVKIFDAICVSGNEDNDFMGEDQDWGL